MTSTLQNRLRRIETARGPSQRVFVLTGHSVAERESKEAALLAAGQARDTDLFVHIRKEICP